MRKAITIIALTLVTAALVYVNVHAAFQGRCSLDTRLHHAWALVGK